MIYVLLGSALVTMLLGDWLDTSVIIGVVVLRAIFGIVQEGKAERALEAIRAMIAPSASVAANVRLLNVRGLRIEALTGGSVPVDKTIEVARKKPDRRVHLDGLFRNACRGGAGA